MEEKFRGKIIVKVPSTFPAGNIFQGIGLIKQAQARRPRQMALVRCQLTTGVVRFQPLPDSQYNGNPESVGYRIKYWRPDLQPQALAQVINDRLEREFTIEGLEEWTEYELQMQAFNAIGAGPWSEAVRGRTRESGKIGALPTP